MNALWFQPSPVRAVPTKLLSYLYQDICWSRISPLCHGETPIPELPSEEWVLVKTRLGGICGSDMAAITLKGSLDNPIRHFISFPLYLGHEIVGDVDRVGDRVHGLEKGQRVAVYPVLSCVPRDISPNCPSCESGDFSLCRNMACKTIWKPPGNNMS